MRNIISSILSTLVIALIVAACGGGSGGDDAPPPQTDSRGTYSLSGFYIYSYCDTACTNYYSITTQYDIPSFSGTLILGDSRCTIFIDKNGTQNFYDGTYVMLSQTSGYIRDGSPSINFYIDGSELVTDHGCEDIYGESIYSQYIWQKISNNY